MMQDATDWPSHAIKRALSLLGGLHSRSVLQIFDVGAHHGELLSSITSATPFSNIIYHAFEPDSRNHSLLANAMKAAPQNVSEVYFNKVALSNVNGMGSFFSTKSSTVSGLLPPEDFLLDRVPTQDHFIHSCSDVEILTLDAYLVKHPITNSISLLKIDTEGNDLRVLEGAAQSLSLQEISVIICEFFGVRYRTDQCYLWDICAYLHSKGYLLDNIYDSRATSQGRLYTGNIVFVNNAVGNIHSFK